MHYRPVHCLLHIKNSRFCIRNHWEPVGNTEKQSLSHENWLSLELTHKLFDHPSNQEVSPEGLTVLRSLSNVRPIKRNYKNSHSVPKTDNAG